MPSRYLPQRAEQAGMNMGGVGREFCGGNGGGD
jgi:hypothetical protein